MCHFRCFSQVKTLFISLLSDGRFLRGSLTTMKFHRKLRNVVIFGWAGDGVLYFRNFVMLHSFTVTISKFGELNYYNRPQTALGRRIIFFVQAFLIHIPLRPYNQLSIKLALTRDEAVPVLVVSSPIPES